MDDTMRDILSKLDSLISETELRDKEDLQAKRKALQDLQMDPSSSDPEIKQAIMRRKSELEREAKEKGLEEGLYQIGDEFGISLNEDFEIGTEIIDILENGVVIQLDEFSIEFLNQQGFTFENSEVVEGKQHGNSKIYDKCWKGYRKVPGKARGEEGSCKKIGEELDEAKYQGREVPLGKPMKGDVKKSKVYVRKPNGKVVKVNFGDKNMKIKKSNPKRRKSFRARHNCANPGPRWKARYWSCRAW